MTKGLVIKRGGQWPSLGLSLQSPEHYSIYISKGPLLFATLNLC